jgi:hypothetical protein
MEEIRSSLDAEFFGQDAQGGVRGDEVYVLNPNITPDGQEQLLKKDRSAGAGGRDGQILWRVIQQEFSGEARSPRAWSIGSCQTRSQGWQRHPGQGLEARS